MPNANPTLETEPSRVDADPFMQALDVRRLQRNAAVNLAGAVLVTLAGIAVCVAQAPPLASLRQPWDSGWAASALIVMLVGGLLCVHLKHRLLRFQPLSPISAAVLDEWEGLLDPTLTRALHRWRQQRGGVLLECDMVRAIAYIDAHPALRARLRARMGRDSEMTPPSDL